MHDRQLRSPRRWLPPWWLLVLTLATDVGTGAWRVITGGRDASPGLFFASLVWPGLAVAGAVLAVAWLGWSLDLD